MSFLTAITAHWRSPRDRDARAQAVRREQDYAQRAPWMGPVLAAFRQLDAAFAAVSEARTGKERQVALRHLHALLSAHSHPLVMEWGDAAKADAPGPLTDAQLADIDRLVRAGPATVG